MTEAMFVNAVCAIMAVVGMVMFIGLVVMIITYKDDYWN
jgi:hypothetical protein